MPTPSTDQAVQGDFAEPPGRTLAETLDMLRRRGPLMAGVALALFALTVVVALALPAVYRSTATILIQEQEIPQDLVRSTVTSYADERIQVISQQVMTRATLLDLVDKYGLYGSARQRETAEEILERMRRDIKLTPISADVTDRRTGSATKATIAFSVSYDSEVAANAQKIANELTTLYLNENLKNRQQKAAESTSFLDDELARVGAQISEGEQKLADFKLRNQGRLPELSALNQASSERTEAEVGRLERDVAFLEDRRLQLQAQLADTRPNLPLPGGSGAALEPEDRLRALRAQLLSLQGVYSDDHPDVKRVRREIASLSASARRQSDAEERAQQLAALNRQLATLRQKYSDEHPDVIRLRRTVAGIESALAGPPVLAPEAQAQLDALKAQIAALRGRYPDDHPEVLQLKRAYAALDAAARSLPASARADELPSPRKPDNPTWINLKAQIDATGSQIDSLRKERAALRDKLSSLEARMMQTPEVEREYLEMARDLDSSRARFRELRDKQMQAQVAEQLERGRKAERFTLIEPPVFPEKPARPNRPLIVLVGLLLSLAGGFGAGVLREALDRTVRGAKDVVRALQVPLLARIPTPHSPARARRRVARLRAALAGSVLLLAATLAAVHWLYRPLDVAWYSLQRRLSN